MPVQLLGRHRGVVEQIGVVRLLLQRLVQQIVRLLIVLRLAQQLRFGLDQQRSLLVGGGLDVLQVLARLGQLVLASEQECIARLRRDELLAAVHRA